MPARIQWNNMPKAIREPLAQAVSDAIGRRPEDWLVKIDEVEADAWDVRVEGANDFIWAHRFEGVERDPTIIGNSLRVAIEMSAGELSVALAELVRQGI